MIYETVSGPEPKPALPGDSRTYRVWLDCNQYRIDMDDTVQGGEVGLNIFLCSAVYSLFLLIIGMVAFAGCLPILQHNNEKKTQGK